MNLFKSPTSWLKIFIFDLYSTKANQKNKTYIAGFQFISFFIHLLKTKIGTKIAIKPYIKTIPPKIINVSVINSNKPYSIPKNSLGKNKRILFTSGMMYVKIGLENSLIWYAG